MDINKFKNEFSQIEAELSAGNLPADILREKTKRHSFLRPVIEKITELESVENASALREALMRAQSLEEVASILAKVRI
jgi:peptide chain release factor 1